MGKPARLLDLLCGHALWLGARSFETERKDGWQRAFVRIDEAPSRIANFKDSSEDGKELRANLCAAAKRAVRTMIDGRVHIVHVRAIEGIDERFEVTIDLAPKLDPATAPRFTAKQGQYLAFIQNYTKINGRPPAESDMERYFQVSPPSVHEMIKTLERNGFIERTPGRGRSIRLLVQPEHVPRLD